MIKLRSYNVNYKKLRGFFSMTYHARPISQACGPLQTPVAGGYNHAKSVRIPVRRSFKFTLLALIGVLLLTLASPKPAAACPDWCGCEVGNHGVLNGEMILQHALTNAWITLQFILHREIFWKQWMWNYNIGNALMMWTNELSATAMAQLYAVGAFFDAKHQMETQRLLQMKMADAHRDYHPDVEMCTIGTAARGLGSTSRRAELTAYALVENQIDRFTNARNSSGLMGASLDRTARFEQVKRRFCDARDDGGQIAYFVCTTPPTSAGRNADIDYGRLVVDPWTINVDLTDATRTEEEGDLLALTSNLYAHNIPPPFPDDMFSSERGKSYALALRAIAAKHSVATYSFASIVGMKTAGSAASAGNAPFLKAVLDNLGATNTETLQIVGPRPSYYAQMELLTKKIYQQPQFYTNLYDAPASGERKSAAIRAIRLIQDMDKFNSVLRTEQNLSVLVEMYVEDMQTDNINTEGRVEE